MNKSQINKLLVAIAISVSFISGCATVPMATKEKSKLVKQFNPPTEGKAGLYVYRESAFLGWFGSTLKKDVYLNRKCLGETAPAMFFYEEVAGDTEHKVSAESEFSVNDLIVKTESGKNYFVRQYLTFGLFVWGADVKLVDEQKGKKEISELEMAIKGTCRER